MSDDLSGFSLIELFRAEAEGQIDALSSGLLLLETAGGAPEVIEPLMRAAHSMKGGARLVGLEPIEKVAHSMEDVFVAAQQGKVALRPGDVDVLLQCVDLIRDLTNLQDDEVASWPDRFGERISAAVEALKAIESGTSSAAAASAAAEPQPAAAADEPERREEAKPSRPKRARKPRRKPTAEGPSPESAPAASSTTQAPEPSPPPPSPPPSLPEPRPVTAVVKEPVVPAAREIVEPRSAPRAAHSEGPDRVVRVTADSLNRLMGLAGASLVEARQLRPIVDALNAVKNSQNELWNRLQGLEDLLAARVDLNSARERELLVKAKNQATRCLELLGERISRLENHARRNEDLSERLHHEVISSRLRPFVDGIRGFPRMVRDLGRQLGKKVNFEIIGEQTGVDRDILEKLESPLTHLIRNALDHALEPPEARTAAGKEPVGSLRIEARHVAGMLQITVTDDGRGMDPERIRRKIIERGTHPPSMAEQLTEAELLDFLFLPGFSTKSEVTEISGRGVGLDVVQSMVQAVGGTLRVSTKLGQGTCFSLLLPITMSVIRALLVRVGGEPYAFPLSRIDRIQTVSAEDIEMIEGRSFFKMDDQSVGLVSASMVLERGHTANHGGELPVVIVSDHGHSFGVVVDEFMGERDLDVRPLDERLGKVPNINSASVLEDGWPVLIIDVEDLVRSIDNLLSGRRVKVLDEEGPTESSTAEAKHILVVDDSITVRELERQLLESRGYEVDVAVDGMDGWNAVRSGQYDGVVSDVDMPRMDGIQLVTQIKSDPRFRALPVVIVSYKDRPEDRLRGLEAGADAYLTKSSFHDETFLNTIIDLIGEAAD